MKKKNKNLTPNNYHKSIKFYSNKAISNSGKKFSCPCNGENELCSHCHGSGKISRLIEPRSRRTLSVNNLSNDSFITKKEKLILLQVNLKIEILRKKFLEKEDNNPINFVKYIFDLIEFIDHGNFFHHLHAYSTGSEKIEILHNSIKKFRNISQDSKLLNMVVDTVITCYQATLNQKKNNQTKNQTKNKNQSIETPDLIINCPYCSKKIYNQNQHNQLYHPEHRTKSSKTKRNKKFVQNRSSTCPPDKYRVEGAIDPLATTDEHNRNQKSLVNSEFVERNMDAYHTWGGRFRDTNGSFGSLPLHDGMDDESSAG